MPNLDLETKFDMVVKRMKQQRAHLNKSLSVSKRDEDDLLFEQQQ